MSNFIRMFYSNLFLLFFIIFETNLILADDIMLLYPDKLRDNFDEDGGGGGGGSGGDGGGGGSNSRSSDRSNLSNNRRNSEKLTPESFLRQSIDANIPIFPERSDAVYFIIAVPGGAKAWGNTLARTLLDMGPPFESPLGPPLRPLFVDLPAKGRFSPSVLTNLCQLCDKRPLVGIIVIGDGQSARAITLAGHAMKLPVLWARGGKATLYGMNHEIQSNLQIILQPSAKEILEAIRALLLEIRTSRQELSSRTSQECSKKWNNLLDIFKKLKDPKTGTAPTTTNADKWPYFSLINDFMSQKHTIISSDRIDSASTSEVNLEEFEPFELEEEHLLSESEFSMAMTELQPSTSTTVRVPTSAKKKKQTMLDHVKQRDGKIMKSIKKIIKLSRRL